MKSKKIALCAATLALAGGMLTGCNKDKEKEKTLSKVSFSGIATTYKSDETIAWEDMVVTFSYSDNSAISFTSDKMEFDVDTPVKSETELIVKTQGLHASTVPHQEDRYYITVAMKEDFTKFYEAGSIAVGLISKDKYVLSEYSLPRNISKFIENGEEAGTADEGSFKKFQNDFTVGTINPWVFEPVATFIEKANTENVDDYTNYEKVQKLYVVDGAQETEVSAQDYERMLLGGGKYQFAAQDAGKKFKIVVSPKDFTKLVDTTPVEPVSFTFNVMEGYNVYTAKELGVLNLTNLKSEDFFGEHAYEEHYRVAVEGVRGEGPNGQERIFIDSNKIGDADPYGYKDFPRVWEKFLVDNGTLTSAGAEKARDVKGVFLQNDIEIQPSDIPQEYFINEADPINATYCGGNNTGHLRDDSSIYAPTTLNELTISGNYFKLDSSAIPLCENTTDGSTCKAFGGLPIVSFTPGWENQIAPGHANLITICGVDTGAAFRENQEYPSTVKRATIKNIRAVGNTGTNISGAEDDLAKKMKVTGLIFAKASYAPVTMENLIIQEFMIGLFGDHGLGQAVGAHAQTNHTLVRDCKVFDCSNSGIFNYRDGGLEVSNTVMKRFGGACLINAGDSDADGYKYQPNTTFTSDCEFENYVTGGEVYYAAVGAASQITQIKNFNAFFAMSSKKLVGPEGTPNAGKMNVIALQMDGDGYVSASNGKYFGTIVMNKSQATEMKVELDEGATTTPLTAKCKTEVSTDASFVLDPADQMGSAMGAAAITGDLLDMDLCLGGTYLSIVFDLF